MLKQQIEAIYENGVLRPLKPLELEDQQRVRITIENGDPLADLVDTELEDRGKKRLNFRKRYDRNGLQPTCNLNARFWKSCV